MLLLRSAQVAMVEFLNGPSVVFTRMTAPQAPGPNLSKLQIWSHEMYQLLFLRLLFDASVHCFNPTQSKPLLTVHVRNPFRSDCSELRSRIGHSMLFHSVSNHDYKLIVSGYLAEPTHVSKRASDSGVVVC